MEVGLHQKLIRPHEPCEELLPLSAVAFLQTQQTGVILQTHLRTAEETLIPGKISTRFASTVGLLLLDCKSVTFRPPSPWSQVTMASADCSRHCSTAIITGWTASVDCSTSFRWERKKERKKRRNKDVGMQMGPLKCLKRGCLSASGEPRARAAFRSEYYCSVKADG